MLPGAFFFSAGLARSPRPTPSLPLSLLPLANILSAHSPPLPAIVSAAAPEPPLPLSLLSLAPRHRPLSRSGAVQPLSSPVTAARYAPAEPRQTKTPLHKQRGFPFGTLPCYLRRKNDGISKSSSLSFSFSAKSSISSNFGTTTGLTGFLALAREMPRILSIKRWRVGSSGSS